MSKTDAMALISQAKKVLRTETEKSARDADQVRALNIINDVFNEVMRG
jgi:hypothetical protein